MKAPKSLTHFHATSNWHVDTPDRDSLHLQSCCLDIQLPKLDGFAVIEQLRAHDATRHTPVVILSNLSEAQLHERGRRVGVLDFLIKS
jgi:CheY-like chemotaxis protein